MKYLIVVSGKSKSGKDEFFKILKSIDPTFKRLAFADKLKGMLAEYNNITVVELEENKAIFRHDLILVGTMIRKVNPLYWVKSIEFDPIYADNNICVTDMRYRNEKQYLEYAKNKKVIFVRIEVSEDNLARRGYDQKIKNLESEIDLDTDTKFPITIDNNGSLDDFIHKVHRFYEDFII